MSTRIVVAGIGTEVGKTIISAILCESLKADYWKPVQAGDLEQSDSIRVKSLVSNSTTQVHNEAYQLTHAMSPHAASGLDGISIEKDRLIIPSTSNDLIIELAGGLMVPLTNDYLNIDWIAQLGYKVILVSSYYLGSINHTLLSWRALKVRNIPILGIVFNGEKVQSSYDVIMHQTQADCLLEVNQEQDLNREIIIKYATRFNI